MLSIEQAIQHCHEKAEELKNKAYTDYDSWTDEGKRMATDCLECANEHEQLAEWLTELKELRATIKTMQKEARTIADEAYSQGYEDGYANCEIEQAEENDK